MLHPIASYRRALGLTQERLAEHVEVHVNTVKRWELGNLPRPKHLAQLAEVLRVPTSQLDRQLRDWRARQDRDVD